MYIYIYIYIYIFFFFKVMAFGVLLRIDCLMATVTHFAATWLILIGWGVSFPVKTFSVFPHFPRQNFLIFGFPFFHFFIFSLRLVPLTPLVAYFALSLLSFLPNFQVRPLFTLSFLSEFCLYMCLLSSFFFLCFPFFFSSGVVSL